MNKSLLLAIPFLILSLGILFTTLTAKSSMGNSQTLENLLDRKAPEISAGTWINTPSRTLADFRGKVVLLEFWTFGCWNCRNTIPHVKELYRKYGSGDFTVIGVHTPEFDREANLSSLKEEIVKLGISYPVVTDNAYETWDNYHQQYWPTTYLIDKKGVVRYIHIGEGNYEKTEYRIKSLLEEKK